MGSCRMPRKLGGWPAHCSGASMHVPSIQRTKGLALSAMLCSRRCSALATSTVDGTTTTSLWMSDSATCLWGARRGNEENSQM